MKKKFDTIIIGTGPAGLGAAFWLSENSDKSILMLDKAKISSGGISRIADVAFANKLVNILDHFISSGREYSLGFNPASSIAYPNLSDIGWFAEMPMPRKRSKTIFPAPRRPIALVTVPGTTLLLPKRDSIKPSFSTPFCKHRIGGKEALYV